jgi:hypothetical protein
VSPHALATDKKDKQILLSSLLKDKFKFEFETISSNVETNYKLLVEIACTLQVLSSSTQVTTYATYTNIALALSYTYLHSLFMHPTSLEDYLKPLRPSDPAHVRLFNYYFKTMEYVAGEIDNSRFVIDELQREVVLQRLVAQQVNVLQGLASLTAEAFAVP